MMTDRGRWGLWPQTWVEGRFAGGVERRGQEQKEAAWLQEAAGKGGQDQDWWGPLL
jgi:glutaredoxin-related protein